MYIIISDEKKKNRRIEKVKHTKIEGLYVPYKTYRGILIHRVLSTNYE